VVQIISSVTRRSWSRFFLGLISLVAGALIIAHPLFNLAFLTLLLGAYFIGSGIARLFESRESSWMVASGILGILLGIIVLAGWPGTSAFTIGLLVGINVLAGGIATTVFGTKLQQRIEQAAR
jgi:uncharacterized membrane protein HdeD (DUF308 family)